MLPGTHDAASVGAAAGLDFFNPLVPAGMSWALQPCDTHTFALFKWSLEERVQAATARRTEGRLGKPALIHAWAPPWKTSCAGARANGPSRTAGSFEHRRPSPPER